MSRTSNSENMYHLLLLPPPPADISVNSLREAYEPALAEVLPRTASKALPGNQTLDIAVQTNLGEDQGAILRSAIYDHFQGLLANLYRLIAFLAVEQKLDLDAETSTDLSIVFIVEAAKPSGAAPGLSIADELSTKGPLVPLRTLSLSTRPWTNVFAVESEAGEHLLRSFNLQRKSFESHNKLLPYNEHRVPGGQSIKTTRADSQHEEGRKHMSIAVGGTFDHLHFGHRLLLSATAFLVDSLSTAGAGGHSITIGITGDELLKNKKYAEVLESWEQRQAAVYRFMRGIISFDFEKEPSIKHFADAGPNGKAVHYTFDGDLTIKCVEISDPFGPTITDESISALVVSAETRLGGKAVNDKRLDKHWQPLDVFEVDVLDADILKEKAAAGSEDFQSKISSTEIRRRLHDKSIKQ